MSHQVLPDTPLHHRPTPPRHLFSTPYTPSWKSCVCCAKKSENCARRCVCSNTNPRSYQRNRKRLPLQRLSSPLPGPVCSAPWTNEPNVFRIGNAPSKGGKSPALGTQNSPRQSLGLAPRLCRGRQAQRVRKSGLVEVHKGLQREPFGTGCVYIHGGEIPARRIPQMNSPSFKPERDLSHLCDSAHASRILARGVVKPRAVPQTRHEYLSCTSVFLPPPQKKKNQVPHALLIRV